MGDQRHGSGMSTNSRSHPTSIDGDRYERFVRLIVQHEPFARAHLRGLLPSWNDVEEVVQEASLVAWRKFDDFQQGTSFGGWFMTIARFEALRYRRKMARSPLVFSADVWQLLEKDVSDAEHATAQLSHLEACLNKMDSRQRDLLLKAHTPGVMIRRIAQEAGRSEQAFYKSLQRWRRTLLDCVSNAMALEES